MASIDRTAYPRFKRAPTARELDEIYMPTTEDHAFVEATARGEGHHLTLMIVLKGFQRLGYAPRLAEVPGAVVQHIRACLHLPPDVAPGYDSPRTLYRHHQAIRQYLGVSADGRAARHAAVVAVHQAAQVMDNPADLINVAIEELVRQRFELPAFSTLDHIAQRVRTLVNRGVFARVHAHLAPAEIARLECLLTTDSPHGRSDLNALKEPPKRATLTHAQEWHGHLVWLLSFGDMARLLAGVPAAKVLHFAAEARALDADGLHDVAPAKRVTLLVCLLHRAQVTARDALAEMFVKRIARLHVQGKEALIDLRERQRATTEHLVSVFAEVLAETDAAADDDALLGRRVRRLLDERGGTEALRDDCAAITAYNGNNYLPLLWPFYRAHRSTLFRLVRTLDLDTTSQDRALLDALDYLLAHEHARGDVLPDMVPLDFATDQWRRTVLVAHKGDVALARRPFELCVFSCLAADLKTGDLCVRGSEEYADYREQLLPWEQCARQIDEYCAEVGFTPSAAGFVAGLRAWLTTTADAVDRGYPENGQVVIGDTGEPVLRRLPRKEPRPTAAQLEAALLGRMSERSLLDVLCNAEHWTGWTRHFGPPSGSDTKLDRATEKYILTTFGYATNMGATQTARHTRGLVTPHMLSLVNHRHVTVGKLDAALRDLINAYSHFDLPKVWGSGKVAAADGTKIDLYPDNLLSEYSIRYGGYGGIAYHHVSDQYVALFSRFISCGTWEAIYILDALFKNLSEIRPDTLHGDTQGQNLPVFALAHLLGVRLQPRIRNWADLVFFRPDKDARYRHIEPLFGEAIDWDLLETHWQDLLQVALSVRAGRMLPSTLLRRLGVASRKNRLYQAFRELGRVVRTVFLLEYISNVELREQIQASTNKVEAYNAFIKWLFFGGDGVIAENDPEEQEKRIKYADVVANALMLQNVVDMSNGLHRLALDGHRVAKEDVATLSPYLTRHVKRFGDYVIDLSTVPHPLDESMCLPI